jgi:NAD(P)H dehydrogenase (quinone)
VRILVTGAGGHLGSVVVERLLRHLAPERVVAGTRVPHAASGLRAQGVDVRRCDFDDAESLEAAFRGIERLLIVSTDGDNESRLRRHRSAVDAAARAGVRFIGYTSLVKADSSPMALAGVHRSTEARIRETGIPFSFLRNNWYIENETGSLQAALADQPIATAAGAGRIGWVSRDDLAEAAAAVLAGSGHENSLYELSGSPRTYAAFAQAAGSVLGRDVRVLNMGDAEYGHMIAGFGLPVHVLELLVDAQRAMRQGAMDVESGDLEYLLGRPPTPLRKTIARMIDAGR